MIVDRRKSVKAVYDSGSNISIINQRIVDELKTKLMKNHNIFRTISGVDFTHRRARLSMKINKIEEILDVHVVKNNNFSYDLLLGLDAIKKFRLIQDENLKIFQKINNKVEEVTHIQDDKAGIFKYSNKNKIMVNSINEKNKIDLNNSDDLNFEEKRRLNFLINKYESIFAKNKYDVGRTNQINAEIKLSENKYIIKKPYRTSIPDSKEIESQINKLLETGLIENSNSPFASPVTLAYKRDENKRSRLCIDFRELNKLVIPDPQPFPRIEDMSVKAGNCEWYTILDINSAFWSIPIKPEDREKTAFVTQEGHWQWTRLPFGLKISPAVFQRTLTNILRKYKLMNFCICYIDDILIFSKTFEEHLEHIDSLLKAVQKEGFKLKQEKCSFAKRSVKYLGHIIEKNKIRPLNDNLEAIQSFPRPKTKKNIRQFLGKINFYYKYLENAAQTLEPLHNLLRKNVNFDWSDNCEKAFQKIKTYLCSGPILSIYNYEKPVYIYTDASGEGFGAVLKQPQENNELHPVAYFSKKLSSAQKKKKAIYLECLAIREAIRYWQHWLIGREFTVITDHKPLENLKVKARTDEELGDLVYCLTQYNFKVIYSPGKDNMEADSLSRNPVLETFDNNEDLLQVVNLITMEEILDDQQENLDKLLKNQHIKKKGEIFFNVKKGNQRIFLSQKLGQKLVKKIHWQLGHIGAQQTILHLRSHYYFFNMDKLVKNYIDSCEICKKNKTRKGRQIGLLSHLGPATMPYEIMSIDTVGGFGGNNSTKRYLHLLVDHFTRFTFISTSSGQDAKDFIHLLDPILKRNKVKILLADQYPAIKSTEFRRYLSSKGVTLMFTSVNCPQSNGLNERLHQTLVDRIRCKINSNNGKKRAWSKIAEDCTSEYNNTIHTVTRYTPRYLLLGEESDIVPQSLIIKRNLSLDRMKAAENSLLNHNKNKIRCDKNRKNYNFSINELVYIEKGNKMNRNKLDEIRNGPFPIIRRVSNSIYEVACGKKVSDRILCHSSKLIPSGKFINLEGGGEM